MYCQKKKKPLLGGSRCSDAIFTNRHEKLRHEVIVPTSAQNWTEKNTSVNLSWWKSVTSVTLIENVKIEDFPFRTHHVFNSYPLCTDFNDSVSEGTVMGRKWAVPFYMFSEGAGLGWRFERIFGGSER